MVPQKYFLCTKFCSHNTDSKTTGLTSFESEFALRKLLFLERVITEIKLTATVRNLSDYRAESFSDERISSSVIPSSICEALCKYELFDYLESWFHNSNFPTYST